MPRKMAILSHCIIPARNVQKDIIQRYHFSFFFFFFLLEYRYIYFVERLPRKGIYKFY